LRSIATAWNAFWFTPSDPTVLGFLRILTGLMLLYTHAVWGLDLQAFFGSEGWHSFEAVQALQSDQFVFSYWWWVPSEWMLVAHVTALAVLGLFTVGLWTRLTSILSFVIVVSYAHRAPVALFGLDQINTMLTLYLAIGPSGSSLSLDRLLVRFRTVRRALESGETHVTLDPPPSTAANFSVRLIQVHMCVIYLFAGLSKLQGPAWWDGRAMWLAFSNMEYQTGDMTWLAHYPWLINAMTHVTIIFEISFWALIWRPAAKPLLLFLAVAMHVGIGACMGMWTFGLVMLIGCTSFLPTEFVKALVTLPGRISEWTFFYDGTSDKYRRAASWLKALDVCHRIRLVDVKKSDVSLRFDAKRDTPNTLRTVMCIDTRTKRQKMF
jgi:hypothetical protein